MKSVIFVLAATLMIAESYKIRGCRKVAIRCTPDCPLGKDENGRDKCVCPPKDPTCETTKCPEGERCFLEDVQCKKDPCPQQPVCKKDCPLMKCRENCFARIGSDGCQEGCDCGQTCADVTCEAGQICSLEEVECDMSPCYLQPACKKDCSYVDRTRCQYIKCAYGLANDANGCQICQCASATVTPSQ